MRKWEIGCLSALVIGVVLLVIFRAIGPINWVLRGFYTNPVCWILATGACLAAIVSLATNKIEGWLITIILGLAWIFWGVMYTPMMMVGIYQATKYEPTSYLVPLTKPRAVSYSEAKVNFTTQNPRSYLGLEDLDYVRGHWIAEIGPSTFWNKLSEPTQGFFVYDPQAPEKVRIKWQPMPYAEEGYLFNSIGYFVRSRDLVAEFDEILYVEDPDSDGYMSIIAIIKRQGWRRVPYIQYIALIRGDGAYERLTPRQAMSDPRLDGVQLIPESLARLRVEAYGWRQGIWTSYFLRRERIQVQQSNINEENMPPYHLPTAKGNMWFTPYGPLGQPSLRGKLPIK